MGLFSAFKTPKAWTGVISEQKIRQFTDSEDDEVTRFSVVVAIDGDTPKQRTLDIDRALYDKAAVGNQVVKAENGKPVIQVGS